jgi:alkylhydroperoxidase/carboxymuconolactone decarboxylase family protein YurZ
MRKRTDPLLRKLRDAKKAGVTREEARELLHGGAREAAKAQGRRDSELALTLAARDRALDEVYGPDRTA